MKYLPCISFVCLFVQNRPYTVLPILSTYFNVLKIWSLHYRPCSHHKQKIQRCRCSWRRKNTLLIDRFQFYAFLSAEESVPLVLLVWHLKNLKAASRELVYPPPLPVTDMISVKSPCLFLTVSYLSLNR